MLYDVHKIISFQKREQNLAPTEKYFLFFCIMLFLYKSINVKHR